MTIAMELARLLEALEPLEQVDPRTLEMVRGELAGSGNPDKELVAETLRRLSLYRQLEPEGAGDSLSR